MSETTTWAFLRPKPSSYTVQRWRNEWTRYLTALGVAYEDAKKRRTFACGCYFTLPLYPLRSALPNTCARHQWRPDGRRDASRIPSA